MPTETFLIVLGALLVLAFAAEGLFSRLRLPPVIVLMASGLLLGPGLHLLPPERFVEVAPHFGALAFLLILFEGGLDLNVDAVLTRLRAGLVLALLGFAVAVAIALVGALLMGMPPVTGVALAIALAPISGSIVLPLVWRVSLRDALRTVVVLEAALADVLAVLAMGMMARLITGGGLAGLLAVGSLVAALFSVGVAVGAGLLWPRVLRRFGEHRYLDALTLGLALILWGAAETLGASGALVVLVFGITLANEAALLAKIGLPEHGAAAVAAETVAGLHVFIAQLTFVVRAFFFVFLGVVVTFGEMPARRYLVAGAVGLFLVAGRRAVLWYLERRGVLVLSAGEALPLSLLQPRGLVSAVLAIEAAHLGFDGDGAFLGVVSLVIVVTNLLLVPAAVLLGSRRQPAS